jgi:hypothetical protein
MSIDNVVRMPHRRKYMYIQGVREKMADMGGTSENDPRRAFVDLDQEEPAVAFAFWVSDVVAQ